MKKNKWATFLKLLGVEIIFEIILIFFYYKYDNNANIIYAVIAAAMGIVAGMLFYLYFDTKIEKRDSKYREYLLEELNFSNLSEDSKEGKKWKKINNCNKNSKLIGEYVGRDPILLKRDNNDEINDEINDYIKKTKLHTTVAKKLDKRDIIALMLDNNDEINEYFQISKIQAKSSFWFSIIACIVGIAMISISLYGVFKMKDTQFAIIGIVGGAITELIAGTVLVIHNKSALQLNYYYDALHENEKFLSAINLADKLDDDTKRDMYMEIIRAQIQSAKDYKKEERNSGKNSD